MSYRGEYTTLNQLRQSGEGAQLNIAGNAADEFLLSLIREVSADIDSLAGRKFAPYSATQVYDAPLSSAWGIEPSGRGSVSGRSLYIDTDDLLAVVALTNGDGTAITTGSLLLYPANVWPKNEIRLKQSAGIVWAPSATGETEQAIALQGVFGFHDDYTGGAWGGAGALAAQIGTTTASAFAFTAGVEPGMLLQIDSEYLYVGSVAGTTATVERGSNGSTAAVHTTAAPIDYWRPIFTVGRITRMASAAYWNLRMNPEGKEVSINGVTFSTPNSIAKWIGQELDQAGLTKTVTG